MKCAGGALLEAEVSGQQGRKEAGTARSDRTASVLSGCVPSRQPSVKGGFSLVIFGVCGLTAVSPSLELLDGSAQPAPC